jgi:hypothetical protein
MRYLITLLGSKDGREGWMGEEATKVPNFILLSGTRFKRRKKKKKKMLLPLVTKPFASEENEWALRV